jgi:hypothetical protein
VGDTDLAFRVTPDRKQPKFEYEYTTFESGPPITFRSTGPVWWGALERLADFDHVERAFSRWLENDVRAYNEYEPVMAEDRIHTDLWAAIDTLPSNVGAGLEALQNIPFSSEEQLRIRDTLQELENEVKRLNLLSTDQIELFHDRIEYLVAASKRFGRKDWVLLAFGLLGDFILAGGLTGDIARQLFHLGVAGLQWIVVHSPALLP